MENELKAYQKKVLIAFCTVIFLAATILVMLSTAQSQRSRGIEILNKSNMNSTEEIKANRIILKRIESKVDILINDSKKD